MNLYGFRLTFVYLYLVRSYYSACHCYSVVIFGEELSSCLQYYMHWYEAF